MSAKRTALRLILVSTVLLASAGCAKDDKVQVLGEDTASTKASEGDGGGESSDTTEGSNDESTSTTAEVESGVDLEVESGMTSEETEYGSRQTSVGALVTNPNKALGAYEVEVLFNLMDAGGVVLDSVSADIPYIAPGSVVPVAPYQIGYDLKTEPASVEVFVTGDLRNDEGWDGVGFMMGEGFELEVKGAAIADGSWGKSLKAQVTNPSEDVVAEYGQWACVLKQGGAIVGGATGGFSGKIPPGVTVALEQSMSLEIVADEVICRAVA